MRLQDYQNLALQTECSNMNVFERLLEKPSTTIQSLRLIHSALGIETELQEIAQSTDQTNLAEEFGDLFWFIALGFTALKADMYVVIDEKSYMTHPSKPSTAMLLEEYNPSLPNIMKLGGEFANQVKALIFYNRQKVKVGPDSAGNFANVDILEYLQGVLRRLAVNVAAFIGYNKFLESRFTLEDVLTKNIDKLRARYPERYSDEKANTRDLDAERAVIAS